MWRMRREQTYFTLTGLLSYDNTLFNDLSLPESLDKNTCITEILMTCGLLEIAYPDIDTLKTIIKVWSFARTPDWERIINALHGEYNPLHNYDRMDNLTVKGTETKKGSRKNDTSYSEKETTDDDLLHTNNLTETNDNTETRDLKNTKSVTSNNTRTDNLLETTNDSETVTHENTAYDAGLTATSRDIKDKAGNTKSNTGTQTNACSETTNGTDTGTVKNNGTKKNTGTYTDARDIERNLNANTGETENTTSDGETETVTTNYSRGNIGVMSTQDLIRQEVMLRYDFNVYEIIAREFKEKFCNLTYIL